MRGQRLFILVKTYWEKLKDPRWQKKRLEIMQRDGFACQNCLNADAELNVHHKIYRKGASPWEYEEHELVTLCKPCHEDVTDKDAAIKEWLVSDENRRFLTKLIELEQCDVMTVESAIINFETLVCYDLPLIFGKDVKFGELADASHIARQVSECVIHASDGLRFINQSIQNRLLKGGLDSSASIPVSTTKESEDITL